MENFQCLESIEISTKNLRATKELGEGQFGKVYEGSLTCPKTGTTSTVAIKMLSKVENSAHEHFFLEAMTMRKFIHPNIIRLIGVVSRESPISLVMEIASYGEMRSFLHQHQMQLQLDHLLLYCYQISNALDYLASHQVVHRDIAARNCLVFTFELVKLADFGLSRLLQDHNYYKAMSKGKMPIKWMAPESIFYRKFTSASDVWMFGVCCWEIFMFGVKPWQGCKNQQVVELVEKRQKLERPNTCPKSVYTILTQCWMYRDNERPTFTSLKLKFKLLYEEYSGKNIVEEKNLGKQSNDKHSSNKISLTDQQLAESESELLKRRLEESIQQTLGDPTLLTTQENFLPKKVPQNEVPKPPLRTISRDLSVNKLNSIVSNSNGETNSITSNRSSAQNSWKRDLENVGCEIFELIYNVTYLLGTDEIDGKGVTQYKCFEIASKTREISAILKSKVSKDTETDTGNMFDTFGKILDSDTQELIRGLRLYQQFQAHKELLMACRILSTDIKNVIERTMTLS